MVKINTGETFFLKSAVSNNSWMLLLLIFLIGCENSPASNNKINNKRERIFIAHRGVDLNNTIAGENSLDAVRLAKRAGFQTVETDVRLTLDSVMVVMHDITLNRTCLNVDGAELTEKIGIADITLKELKSSYILKAIEPQKRTNVPTLREFLVECKQSGVIPFIEPKIYDETGRIYKNIIKLADEVMGKNNYVITSNNKANAIIRKIGLNDVPLMGILHQTTFEEILSLGNTIIAISTSQFSLKDYNFHVCNAKEYGLQTESHADNFERFTMINNNKIDYVSTDFLAPDLKDDSKLLVNHEGVEEFYHTGYFEKDVVVLSANDELTLKNGLSEVYFGGVYLEMEIRGKCDVVLANQTFSINNSEFEDYRHQLLVYNSIPNFSITAIDQCVIKNIRYRLAEF